ncbi:MAG: flagellar biosynthetic protein FliP, partial [Butyrivibrio sp.]|nr:flagellar biosynthetic protein FliP [Butyrivibrio sp.]
MIRNRGEELNKYVRKYLRKGVLAAIFCLIMASFLVFSLPQVAFATENVISDTTPTDPTVDRDSNLT